MDNPHHYKWLLLEPEAQFTMSHIASREESLLNNEHDYQFTGPTDFDFENHVLFISFGREVRELECAYDMHYRGYYFTITYDKEYQENKVFFYQIEKRNFVPPDFVSDCYWIDSGEKVYLGDQHALVTFQK
jgi:hypothetical protein